MFKSGLTKGMYTNFLQDYRLNHSELATGPYLFVDPKKGTVKLLTNLISTNVENDDFFALSIADDGDVEVLSTEQDF